MRKRSVINLLAAMVVLAGGLNLAVASSAVSPVRALLACSGGGGSCSCDAGQVCMHYAGGCACKNPT